MHEYRQQEIGSFITKREVILAVILHILIFVLLIAVQYLRVKPVSESVFEAELWSQIPLTSVAQSEPIESDVTTEVEQLFQQQDELIQSSVKQQLPAEPLEPELTNDEVEIIEQQRKLVEQQRQQELEQQRKLVEQQRQQELEQQRELAEQRRKEEDEKAKQAFLARQMQQVVAPDVGASSSGGAVSDSYVNKIRAAIQRNTQDVSNITANPEVIVRVNTAPDGTILTTQIVRSSGQSAWDQAVLRALNRLGKMPLDNGMPPPASMDIKHKYVKLN